MTNYFSVKKNTNYTLTVSKSGYETHTETINISADTTKNITLTPDFTPETLRFDYTGDVQTYTVPQGCTKLIVDCVGAAGGTDPYGFRSGLGGRVQTTMTVTGGDVLYIYVGEKGKSAPTTVNTTNSSAFNGGGYSYRGVPPGSLSSAALGGYGAGGGGASDIRLNGTSLNDRKIVAGGGGGGFITSNNRAPQTGGAGGGLTGGNGGVQVSGEGQGGSQSAGGGRYGSFGQGGCFNSQNGSTTGGGGGYYGGGAGQAYLAGGGAGGGGSSYTDQDLCTEVIHTQGYSEASGNGWIIITTSNE